ncbi:MAG: large conductance mechanosensitive channel protein MscL [Sulfurimonas sp.]|uniref:large conductance mechanosensitive channel protein MscL n=1 Tax=Sulfurimonas sp. TaxID=2022749 RepID=UPI0026058FD4|nr:large conductance mechanosensitive channel protein MscL [Sulfurimonas sp.]MDD2651877.1 large conductance mechanosensitive channel protein MscL [Sulfurimonas sp.]MDD3451806.1 large conductance mechanosensitive channel protein MscL [Sulfurimonas sp.]
MFEEFKKFLIKGNMVDMAVGFIFGAAFATLVQSLVKNIIMPPVGMLLGRVDFSNLFLALDGNSYNTLADLEKAGAPAIKIGVFVNDIISFLILGTVMFMLVKSYNTLRAKEEVPPPPPADKICSECAMSIPIAAKKCPYCGNTQL